MQNGLCRFASRKRRQVMMSEWSTPFAKRLSLISAENWAESAAIFPNQKINATSVSAQHMLSRSAYTPHSQHDPAKPQRWLGKLLYLPTWSNSASRSAQHPLYLYCTTVVSAQWKQPATKIDQSTHWTNHWPPSEQNYTVRRTLIGSVQCFELSISRKKKALVTNGLFVKQQGFFR